MNASDRFRPAIMDKIRVPPSRWDSLAAEIGDWLRSQNAFEGESEDAVCAVAYSRWDRDRPCFTDFRLALSRLQAIRPAIRGGRWSIQLKH